MAIIVAGRFDTVDKARAVEGMLAPRFGPERLSVFYNGPAGQHAAYPIGGDEDKDPGARKSDAGAAKGAAIGAGAGLAIGAVGGPVTAAAGAGVGAYTGSLIGAVKSAKGADEPSDPVRRSAGIILAIEAEDATAEAEAIRVLAEQGADEIEKAHGEWRDGKWVDFDPAASPNLVATPSGSNEETRQPRP